jgi:hypothetical protein
MATPILGCSRLELSCVTLATNGSSKVAKASDVTATVFQMMFRYAEQVHDHRRRAELFRHHAAATRSPNTRKMYLRLATTEEALAEWAERLSRLVANDSEIEGSSPSVPLR